MTLTARLTTLAACLLACLAYLPACPARAQVLVGTPTVQINAVSGTAYTYTPASTSDLVFVIASTAAGSDTYTIANSGGETTHPIDTYNPVGASYASWYFQASTLASHSITITTNLSDGYKLDICEFSAVQTTTPIDGSPGHTSGNSTNPDPNITTSVIDLIFVRVQGGAPDYTPPAGYSKVFSDCTNGFCDAYRVDSPGTHVLTWTAASAPWITGLFGVISTNTFNLRKNRVGVINR